MKNLRLITCTNLLCLCLAFLPRYGGISAQTKSNMTQKIVSSMTLEEKAALVVGMGMRFELPSQNKDSAAKKQAGPVVGSTQDLVPGAAGTTYSNQRLGITPMVLADGPAGLRIQPERKNDTQTYYCTAFPVGTVLASTWDTALVHRVGEAMGNEVREYGADILLAPALNIHRNPLCGRNFEYYSEDPLVSGKITASVVKGVQSQGVGTSIKHFAANNQETNRNTVNTIVSERALREIYLEGFRIAVQESQPWTVMSSYNKINGTYTSESHDLLTKILRDEWGFKGLVMTDWFGGTNPVAQMKAGNDLLMPGTPKQTSDIVQAVKNGFLDEKVLDRNCERILSVMMASPRFKKYSYSNKPDLKAHAQVTRQAATDGMVLLKNNKQALPLAKDIERIAVFGNTSYDIIKGGTGSGNVNAAYSVSLTDGLSGAGYQMAENLKSSYVNFIAEERKKLPKPKNIFEEMMGGTPKLPEMSIDASLAAELANTCDVALITIGRNSGEGKDRQEENDFNLSSDEKTLISTVSKAFHDKGKAAIVILNIGGVIEVASWRDIPDAILLAWQPGQEAGNSIADVISGKVNPSGKLASTFPIVYNDVPSAKNFPGIELPDTSKNGGALSFMQGKPSEVVYEEDIFVGYRYYNTFQIPVAYEFGYGLSYTSFEYGKLKLSNSTFNNQITVTLDVKNTGKVAGREVVELYLTAPKSKFPKPASELKGFAKTKMLAPGESQTIQFVITKRNLSSFDAVSSSWVADAGDYSVQVGASSSDIRQKAGFRLPAQLTVEKVNKALSPSRSIKPLVENMNPVR
ncbi:MAG TPA: glycoside hydrolase family 3 C-terminal domain-containing protein [Bacteroidales bacterium]|nr:glycoside hydrolase family 3 C-terminal domain-containing protein [Bacteroidales bacterium]